MVFTLDKKKRPLGHCSPKRARQLMERGRACVYRYYPFTIIVKDKDVREMDVHHHYRIKIDPGVSYTGIAVVEEDRVIAYFELRHRGDQVVKNLRTRNAARRNRRNRETVYRKPKFQEPGQYESSREEGWLPPSQMSVVNNVLNFVKRLERLLGPCAIDMELVKFDAQLMENPDIEGAEYQRGTLYGYELRAYLMEKYQHTCQYCAGASEDPVLEWEHIIPKSRGGSDRVKNATLACHSCNQAKGSRTPEEWLRDLSANSAPTELDKRRISCLGNVIRGKGNGLRLRYFAWSNSTRWRLYEGLSALSVDGKARTATGGRTAFNRHKLGIPKSHHLDALCCADVPEQGYRDAVQPYLVVKAMGRGGRLLGQTNACGIITVKYRDHHKRVNGLQTGDIVHADVPKGKYKGSYTGRIMVRSSGIHDIRPMNGKRFSLTKKTVLTVLQHLDGYQYTFEKAIPLGN